MLTEHKAFLRGMEWLAALSGACGLVSGLLVLIHFAEPKHFEPFVFYSLALMFIVFGTSVLTIVEYVRATRSELSWLQRARGLSFQELKALTRWAPRWMIYLSLGGLFLALSIMLPIGHVKWSPGLPFTEREALGFTAGLSAFCFIALPIIASAARMPGTFFRHDA